MNPIVKEVVEELFKFVARLIANKALSAQDRAAVWDQLALRAKAQAKLDARKVARKAAK